MKTIALIDTRLEVPGVSLGILVSTHPNVMAAFAANDAFQKAEASGRHIRTKIITLKNRLNVGQPVQPAHLAESKLNQSRSECVVAITWREKQISAQLCDRIHDDYIAAFKFSGCYR